LDITAVSGTEQDVIDNAKIHLEFSMVMELPNLLKSDARHLLSRLPHGITTCLVELSSQSIMGYFVSLAQTPNPKLSCRMPKQNMYLPRPVVSLNYFAQEGGESSSELKTRVDFHLLIDVGATTIIPAVNCHFILLSTAFSQCHTHSHE
jgi:hypothetical protein